MRVSSLTLFDRRIHTYHKIHIALIRLRQLKQTRDVLVLDLIIVAFAMQSKECREHLNTVSSSWSEYRKIAQ